MWFSLPWAIIVMFGLCQREIQGAEHIRDVTILTILCMKVEFYNIKKLRLSCWLLIFNILSVEKFLMSNIWCFMTYVSFMYVSCHKVYTCLAMLAVVFNPFQIRWSSYKKQSHGSSILIDPIFSSQDSFDYGLLQLENLFKKF